jgi:hypothetical protein
MLTGCPHGVIMSRGSLGACRDVKTIQGLRLLAAVSAAIEITAWITWVVRTEPKENAWIRHGSLGIG